jgi:16S rRNA (guanine527-N7)-methyltransferase
LTVDCDAFSSACRELVSDLPENRVSDLLEFGRLVRNWNIHFNMVSRQDAHRIETYHILDSLAAASLVPGNASACDIGSGAGFPGIPLAIARPDVRVTLIDSSRKKCRFLRESVSTLGLRTVQVVNDRAESVPSLECDVVLSRLTTSVERFVRESHHHRAPRGFILLYKTPESAVEIRHASPLLAKYGLTSVRTTDIVLPITGIVRRFVALGIPAADS